MGGPELMRRSVGSPEGDRNVELPAGHREHIRGIVYHLVEGHERKAECHELDDRAKSHHRRAHSHPGKSVFTDRGVDDSFRAKAIQQTLADFVSSIVLRHFLAQQEDIRVALKLFHKSFIQRLAISDLSQAHAPAVLGTDRPSDWSAPDSAEEAPFT